jgi:DNA-binding transcriptional ArsR family regulator
MVNTDTLDGNALLALIDGLSNPQRLRIVAALAPGRNYVSQLARDLHMSRPLLYLHLQRLEAAGIVRGLLELSDDGKAMKYFEVVPFSVTLTPDRIVKAMETLTLPGADTKQEET